MRRANSPKKIVADCWPEKSVMSFSGSPIKIAVVGLPPSRSGCRVKAGYSRYHDRLVTVLELSHVSRILRILPNLASFTWRDASE